MKVAIFGASGMLGSMLVDYLSPRFEVTALTRSDIDVANFYPSELAEIMEDQDWVINAVGVIPQRSKDGHTMMRVNACFPVELARFHDTPIIQIATDCVFSGATGEYLESDIQDATDDYARSKAHGEIRTDNFYNLRCSIVGREPKGNYSLLGWLLSQPQGATVRGYTNHLWNGITTLHFAKICEAIVRYDLQELPNVQHIIPADYVSKCQLLRMAAAAFGRTDITVKAEAHGVGVVDRRLSTSRMDLNQKLWGLAGYKRPLHISEMLRELAEYKAEVKVH